LRKEKEKRIKMGEELKKKVKEARLLKEKY